MIHLLTRVACTAVRLTFDRTIPPDQLRKTLDKHKTLMGKQYKYKEINDYQWDLLFGYGKG